MVIERKKYLDKLISKKDNGLIKVITGIRRCGKSFLLFELYHEYLNSVGITDDCIIEMALDEVINAKYKNPFELDKYVRELTQDKSKRFYVFIDEVQLVVEMQNPYVEKGDSGDVPFLSRVTVGTCHFCHVMTLQYFRCTVIH